MSLDGIAHDRKVWRRLASWKEEQIARKQPHLNSDPQDSIDYLYTYEEGTWTRRPAGTFTAMRIARPPLSVSPFVPPDEFIAQRIAEAREKREVKKALSALARGDPTAPSDISPSDLENLMTVERVIVSARLQLENGGLVESSSSSIAAQMPIPAPRHCPAVAPPVPNHKSSAPPLYSNQEREKDENEEREWQVKEKHEGAEKEKHERAEKEKHERAEKEKHERAEKEKHERAEKEKHEREEKERRGREQLRRALSRPTLPRKATGHFSFPSLFKVQQQGQAPSVQQQDTYAGPRNLEKERSYLRLQASATATSFSSPFSSAQSSELSILRLVEMGFPREEADSAWAESNGDFPKALLILRQRGSMTGSSNDRGNRDRDGVFPRKASL